MKWTEIKDDAPHVTPIDFTREGREVGPRTEGRTRTGRGDLISSNFVEGENRILTLIREIKATANNSKHEERNLIYVYPVVFA